MPPINIYDTATGKIANIPQIVRHFPLTSSTINTKLTIVTPIDAKPTMTLSVMNIANELENANRIPVIVIHLN